MKSGIMQQQQQQQTCVGTRGTLSGSSICHFGAATLDSDDDHAELTMCRCMAVEAALQGQLQADVQAVLALAVRGSVARAS